MKISTSHKISHGSIALRILLPTLLGGLLAVCQASADRSVRCEGRIVSIGTFKEEVREKCGTPDHLEEWEEGQSTVISEYYDYEKERYILPRFIPGPIRMERWTYNFGSTRLIHYLYFKNGQLYRIETGDKGSD
ncbi:MAG: DUF2845 domain-containing protein [Desulfatitalea sp.]|nr:DUF2845 domain-containing protein [Desulfatitalea sp.]